MDGNSKPPYIISVNYLDLDQAFATHKFQVQSRPQIKTVVNIDKFERTWDSSRLKTRYLKGITVELLFIISIYGLTL